MTKEELRSERTVEVQEPWQFVLQYLAIKAGDPAETGQIDIPIEKLFWDLCRIENPTSKRFAVYEGPQKLQAEIKRLKMMGCVEISYSRHEWQPDIKAVAITKTGLITQLNSLFLKILRKTDISLEGTLHMSVFLVVVSNGFSGFTESKELLLFYLDYLQ